MNAAHPALSAQDWAQLAAGVALWVLAAAGDRIRALRRREVTSVMRLRAMLLKAISRAAQFLRSFPPS